MRLGMIQGRLSEPIEGFQECPKNWRIEFEKAETMGLSHVEWIVTQKSFSYNPIFFENVSELPIHTICADNVVSDLIDNEHFLNHNLIPICEAAMVNNIDYITIPLLEDSSVEDLNKIKKFRNHFFKICKKYPSIKFSLETELSLDKIPILLDVDNVYLTYDTGNTTSYGVPHKDYIEKFVDRISNVHIKDRTFAGKTVIPTTGDTNFYKIFKLLISAGYTGPYTLQTAREDSKKEIQTIKKHANVIRSIYEECKKHF